jgi:DNA-binding beta-propeller fold protein YncE
VDAVTEPAEQNVLRTYRVYFAVLLIVWMLGAWISYTIAGEKMPWLLTHMAVPMSVLGGWWFGYLVQQIDWRAARTRGALVLIGFVPALIFVTTLLFGNRPFGGRELAQVGDTMTWLLALLALGGLGAGGYVVMRRIGVGAALRLAGLGLIGLMLLLTIRFSYMLNYINYDMATEYLVYAHASPDVKRALAEIDLISERTVGERNIVVAYDDDTSWPLSWYMRQYPNARFYGANPTSDAMQAPVIIVGPKNYEKVRPYVARDYVKRTYRLVWWPDQGYFNTTWERFFSTLTDPEKMRNLFQIVFYRRYPDAAQAGGFRDLTQWPNRHEFEMYVRRDIAQQVWNLNVTPTAMLLDPQEQTLRERSIDLPAVNITAGVLGDLPLLTPRAVAVGADGMRVVADSGNHRIVWLDAEGGFIRAVGSLCRIGEGEAGGCVDPDGTGPLALGDGQFNEPWGVAVDAEGQVFVSDTWNGRIQVFDAAGNFVRKWGFFNTTNGELGDPLAIYGPRGIAIDSAGYLVVADTGNKRILQYTPEGELVQQIGGGGIALGRFEEPTAVGVDPRDGSIFVADAWNRRIQKLDPNLVPLAEWPVSSWGSQHLYYKPYLTVAGNGDVYATDPENFRVIVFNSAGGIKASFGSFGTEPGRFGLPNGIAWDAGKNTVVVADADNQRLVDFAVLP